MQHWIFGYGSLIWRVDFPYHEREKATIDGWSRRFWQGSHDHRGTPEAPGRVLTLIPDTEARCVGMAYLVDEDVFEHLDYREKNGYERVDVDIRLAGRTVAGVTYIGAEGNFAYLGPAPPRGSRRPDHPLARPQRPQHRLPAWNSTRHWLASAWSSLTFDHWSSWRGASYPLRAVGGIPYAVVALISDIAIFECTSCTPGICDRWSKKNRS